MLVAAFTISMSLLSEPPTSVTAPEPTAAQKQVVKLKCEKIVVLGSRMPVRVCRTPEQIAAQAKDTEDAMRRIRSEIQESPPADVKR